MLHCIMSFIRPGQRLHLHSWATYSGQQATRTSSGTPVSRLYGRYTIRTKTFPGLTTTRRQGLSNLRFSRAIVPKHDRYQIRLVLYYLLQLSAIAGLSLTCYSFLRQDHDIRFYSAPTEWDRKTQSAWVTLQKMLDQKYKDLPIDWERIGSVCCEIVISLEKNGYEANGYTPLKPNTSSPDIPKKDQPDLMVTSNLHGISSMGYDITGSSKAWSTGLFDAMIGMAKSAEQGQNWVRDRTTGYRFMADMVVSPKHPSPRPTITKEPNPRAENCEPVYEPPSFYYERILSTHGFSSRQLIDAAISYAEWLELNSEMDAAEELYRWSFGKACESFAETNSTVSVDEILNSTTGMIRPTALFVTTNILVASGALASHLAQRGQVDSALEMMTADLRARQASPWVESDARARKSPQHNEHGILAGLIRWRDLLLYPLTHDIPGFTSDHPFTRSIHVLCDEAILELYIAGLLFGSGPLLSDKTCQGLEWTRNAVETCIRVLNAPQLSREENYKCRRCVESGLVQWQRMCIAIARAEAVQSSDYSTFSEILNKLGLSGQTKIIDWRRDLGDIQSYTQALRDDQATRRRPRKQQTFGQWLMT